MFLFSFFLFFFSCEKTAEKVIPYLSLEDDTIQISWMEQNIMVNVLTNSDFVVSTDCDWLYVTKVVKEKEEYLEITVSENSDTISSRIGNIFVKNETDDLSTVLCITQSAKSLIRINTKVLELTKNNQDVVVRVKYNCGYNISIPDSFKSWIAIKNASSLTDSTFILSIAKNDSYYQRSGFVVLSDYDNAVQDTLNIIQDECFVSLRMILRDNKDVSIFYNALQRTHLIDSISNYFDATYVSPSYDSTLTCFFENPDRCAIRYNVAYESNEVGVFPEKRLFKYTFFIVPDSILESDYNIHNVDDLRIFAEGIYGGVGLSDTLRESPLNMLLSYHILPFMLTYDQLNISQQKIIDHRTSLDELDVEDFYETLLPHSLMRISSVYNVARNAKVDRHRTGIYINRKGTEKFRQSGSLTSNKKFIEGIIIRDLSIRKDFESSAANGIYYYVDKILLYDENARNVFDTRIRVMASTLSPDFINSGARGRLSTNAGDKDCYTVGFKRGFCKNFEWSQETEFYVRYRNASFGSLYGDETILKGNYDFSFKLPSVPNDGIYEIRLFDNSLGTSPRNDRGVVAYYIREGKNGEWQPCSKSVVDLRLCGSDPTIGWVQYKSDSDSLKIDMTMRDNGYMKAPDIYDNINDSENCYRIIVEKSYLKADVDYYLRFCQKDPNLGVFPFDFVEIVPYSVFSGESGREDRH